MKKIMVVLSLGFLAANIASASTPGPRAFCRSDDRVKVVRVKPAAFGNKMQAEVMHEGVLQYILKCEYNPDYLYYCTDGELVPRVFTLQHDGITGLYEGSRETRDLTCRLLN